MSAVSMMKSLGLLAILGVTTSAQSRPRAASNYDTLRELNQQYIQAFLSGDAAWYDAHLTEDFVCILTSGTPISRAEFLATNRRGPGEVEAYTIDDVTIRIHGNAALVGALGSWRRKDGTTGKTRYVDVYVKTGGSWKVASAQLTAVAK